MKILYVEDDLAVASVAKFLFLKTNHHLVFCQTIADAINIMTTCGQQVDLVLLDLHLPDGGGVELLKHMKAIGSTTPVIITTGFYNDHIDELAPYVESGCIYNVMHKPFLPEVLIQTLSGLEKLLTD